MNPYEILGVEPTADKPQIEKAYRSKARKTHPDHGGDKDEFKQLALAYSILKDDDKRKHFDETGSSEPEDREDSAFRQLIIEAFMRSENPIELALKKVQSDLNKTESAQEAQLSAVKTLEKRLAKFQKSNHPDSDDKQLIIESIEAAVAKHRQDAKALDSVLSMLTRFKNRLSEFKSPETEAQKAFFMSASSASSPHSKPSPEAMQFIFEILKEMKS